MADGDDKKTVILRKSSDDPKKKPDKPNKPAAETAAATLKHGGAPDKPAAKPAAPAADPGRTEIVGSGAKGDTLGTGKPPQQAAPPPPPPPPAAPAAPAPSASAEDNRTQVYRPGQTPAAAPEPAEQPSEPKHSGAEGAQSAGGVANPVVGWLVVVQGPGAGGYRPIFYGRNRIGRTTASDVPMDFGDSGISKEQAIIHYDAKDRKFLFIPQLDVENFSYVNQSKPTAPVELKALDEIEMAATTVRFVPLCGPKFDWSDLDKK